MSDKLKIDSHKLMFHPSELLRWQRGEDIYPIYVEISPTGACNHRCLFCALDYVAYPPRHLDTELFRKRIAEMGRLGVKSLLFGGEGEPLLHKDIAELILSAKESGIDAALTTNGVLLGPPLSERILPALSWVKVSVNAGTAATHALLHRTSEEDFDRIFQNLAAAARIISNTGSGCVLGVQAILLPENAGEMERLAERARDAGAAYLVIKSYSQHGKSLTRRYESLDYARYLELEERLARFSDDRFEVVFRARSMRKLAQADRRYGRCLSLPFWSYIDSAGNVWGCSAHLGDERFRYGSLYEQSFEEIWKGEWRRASLTFVAEELDPAACRANCRMDEVNRFLWGLSHPPAHVNFI